MANIIANLKQGLNNLFPKTFTKCVYDEAGNRLDNLLQGKVDKGYPQQYSFEGCYISGYEATSDGASYSIDPFGTVVINFSVKKVDDSALGVGLKQVAQLPAGFYPPMNVNSGAYIASYGSGPAAIRIIADGKIYVSVTNENTTYVAGDIVYRLQEG